MFNKINWAKLLRAIQGLPEPEFQGLRDFETYAELEAWFELHDELRMPEPNLCDDYSEESWHLAEADGYYLSQCLVDKGKAYESTIFTKPDGTIDESAHHIANAAKVKSDQSYWYVDLAWRKLLKLCNFYIGGKY